MKQNLEQVLKSQLDSVKNFEKASVKGTATGSFNILDLDMAFSVLDAAESLQTPVIIGIASRHFDDIRAPLLVPSLLKAIESVSVPAVLHLDHAAPDQFDMIKQALDLGFTSIMIDGSLLPLDDNIEITHKVVELSHRYDASVEGEIGGIAGEEGVADTQQESPEDIPYTDVTEAQRFISATNVDALAIAVGTAHGIYKSEPHINFDVIKEIASLTDIPLVMHGATGVSDSAIQKSITLGIRKINYFSGLLQTAMNKIRSYNETSNDYHSFKNTVSAQWQKVITEQMKLFANTP